MKSTEPLPNSARAYVEGKLHPGLLVPFREIRLNPTKAFNGATEPNGSVFVYDCAGPWGDAKFHGNVEEGLLPLRRDWILARGDVEEVTSSYKPIPGRSDAPVP